MGPSSLRGCFYEKTNKAKQSGDYNFSIVILPLQVARSAGSLEKLSSELCLTQGFSSNLLCSACGNLGEFKLNELEGTCRQCCQDDTEEDNFTVSSSCASSVSFHFL